MPAIRKCQNERLYLIQKNENDLTGELRKIRSIKIATNQSLNLSPRVSTRGLFFTCCLKENPKENIEHGIRNTEQGMSKCRTFRFVIHVQNYFY
jgi:hypothetical protein